MNPPLWLFIGQIPWEHDVRKPDQWSSYENQSMNPLQDQRKRTYPLSISIHLYPTRSNSIQLYPPLAIEDSSASAHWPILFFCTGRARSETARGWMTGPNDGNGDASWMSFFWGSCKGRWHGFIPATSKRQFFGRFCQTVKIFDDLRKNWRFRQKLPIGPSSLACPNKSIYLFYALSKDQMQSWKASIATNASPPIASVLDRTAPGANKCFSFSFSLAEYLFVSNARRLNRGHMCLC